MTIIPILLLSFLNFSENIFAPHYFIGVSYKGKEKDFPHNKFVLYLPSLLDKVKYICWVYVGVSF